MRIAVCDYSPNTAASIRDMIDHYCALYEIKNCTIRCIHTPGELLSCEERFEIVFMGFGGGGGFDAARQLRERDRSCRIILVDDTQEYAIRGVRLHCTDFILRPVEFRHVVQSMHLAVGGCAG